MKRLNLNLLFIFFVFLFVAVRLIAAYFFSDTYLDNEWGKLVHNLELSGIFGINVVIYDFHATHKFANPGDIVLPSIFMPPLYAYFIYFTIRIYYLGLTNIHICVKLHFVRLKTYFKIELSYILQKETSKIEQYGC